MVGCKYWGELASGTCQGLKDCVGPPTPEVISDGHGLQRPGPLPTLPLVSLSVVESGTE